MSLHRIDASHPLSYSDTNVSAAQITDFNHCQIEAEKGNLVAMRLLAKTFEASGYQEDAYKWFKLSAKKGDLLGMNKTAFYLAQALEEIHFNENISENEREVLINQYETELQTWAIKSVKTEGEEGDGKGWVILADYLWNVKGSTQSEYMDESERDLEMQRVNQFRVQAIGYYMLAAHKFNLDAVLKLGSCYDSGEGVKRDSAQSHHWFQLARTIVLAKNNNCNNRLNKGVAARNLR